MQLLEIGTLNNVTTLQLPVPSVKLVLVGKLITRFTKRKKLYTSIVKLIEKSANFSLGTVTTTPLPQKAKCPTRD